MRRTRPLSSPRISITALAGRNYVSYLRRHLRRARPLVGGTLDELSVVLVGDRTMAGLHQRFMDIATPTDVLSFAMDTDSRGRATSGEVVLCVPEARRRAGRAQADVVRELLLYALHGWLHLCGLDDRTPTGYRSMHRREDDILARLGVGRVFASGQECR